MDPSFSSPFTPIQKSIPKTIQIYPKPCYNLPKGDDHTMKKILTLITLLILTLSPPALAHSGGTDANGGHTNTETGEYHYHHGYEAHQHPDGICPYNYDDATQYSPTTPIDPPPEPKPEPPATQNPPSIIRIQPEEPPQSDFQQLLQEVEESKKHTSEMVSQATAKTAPNGFVVFGYYMAFCSLTLIGLAGIIAIYFKYR